jgi:Protein of unknown function (DUF3352)
MVTTGANFCSGTGRILSELAKEGVMLSAIRRVLIPIALAALVLAGCGSSSSSSSSNALQTELTYVPAGSPLVLSLETDPNGTAIKGVNTFAGKFPFASLGESALLSQLQQSGINYDADVKPLLGNPVILSAGDSTLTGSAESDFVFVWIAKDAGKLTALIKNLSGLKTVGSHDSATLFSQGDQTTIAVNGATVLLGPSVNQVEAALDRHVHGGGMTTADYQRAFTGLPSGGVLKVFGNLNATLSTPTVATARRIPWVAAFRGYAASVSASSSGLTADFRLDTTGGPLTSAQVPFAAGSSAPSFAGNYPITVSVHDPTQVAAFVESAAHAASPQGFAKFLARDAAVQKKTGASLNSLLKLLAGDLIVASDTNTTMGRVQVSDPAAAASNVSKLLSTPQSVFSKRTKASKAGGGFYKVTEAKGTTFLVGVVGNELVVGKATPAQLRTFAVAPTTSAPGTQGTVAFRVALVELLRLTLGGSMPSSIAPIISSLGDVTGWMSSSPSGVTGRATLAVK